jgi:hypothetical protein
MKLAAFFLIALGLLTGCASRPEVKTMAAPSMTMGYVAGRFTLERAPLVTAFVLTNVATERKYWLPFGSGMPYEPGSTETKMIALEPGVYRIANWTVFNGYWSLNDAHSIPIEGGIFEEPLDVKAGEVIFLGRFTGRNDWFYPRYEYSWRANRIEEAEAQKLLAKDYPQFAGLKFSCVECRSSVTVGTDPGGGPAWGGPSAK